MRGVRVVNGGHQTPAVRSGQALVCIVSQVRVDRAAAGVRKAELPGRLPDDRRVGMVEDLVSCTINT
jgi:hypothetical protein